jgi:murein DD-endopeptidase MepM/ murein hydrolase activator NlpD
MLASRTTLVVLLLSLLAVVCVMQSLRVREMPEASDEPIALGARALVPLRAVEAGITRENIASADAMQALFARRLMIPVVGVDRSQLRDDFTEMRGGTRRHEAIDIMAARGTPVIAADDGTIARLTRHGLGGTSIYQYDPQAHYAYYYAHLDHYAAGLHEGQRVARGEVIGYVGTTGNAPPLAPHLHFTILDLASPGRRWKGSALDPYPFLVAPGH